MARDIATSFWVLAGVMTLVGVAVQGCGAPEKAKTNDLALEEDDTSAKDKKKKTGESADGETETNQKGSVELGRGTKGTESESETEGNDPAATNTAPDMCTKDAQCNQAGRICEKGACVKGCRNTAGCPVNQVCGATGQCAYASVEVECYESEECFLGDICVKGACIEGCYSQYDCWNEAPCVAGKCQPPTSGGTSSGGTSSGGTTKCTSDGQCNPGNNGSGLICGATGTCIPGCNRDAHCPGTKVCSLGQCK